jgi:hypothetical protein
MISDGLKSHGKEESVKQLDVAEILLESCALDGAKKGKSKKSSEPADVQADA